MNITERRIKLINETAAFFNITNRCVDYTGHCQYFALDKPGCAIGRLIEDKELCKRLDDMLSDTGVNMDAIFSKFPIELQELGQQFLYDLQYMHDLSEHWTEIGLSKAGENYKQQLIDTWSK
jgi:hypothetical protein